MKIYIQSMAKEMSRGVFRIVDDTLLAFPFTGEYQGGIARSGNTYNHRKLWDEIRPKGCNKPYNYYPRGRVEITNKGKPVVYLNPNIDIKFIPEIKAAFGLREDPVIRYDHSEHYKCYPDRI